MKKIISAYYLPLLICILAFSFFTRIARLHLPERYIFDEVYHAVTDKLIARNDPRAFEWWNQPVEPDTAVDWLHPPLAKYTQALPIKILGENSFAWRISSVIFGVLVIAATAKLSNELFDNKRIALLSALLASLDGLLLVQSRIAMNDIHVTFFILLTLILYQKRLKTNQKKYLLLSGLSAGLAIASKWSGLFVLIFISSWELLHHLSSIKLTKFHLPKEINWTLSRITIFFLIPIVVYISSYFFMFAQGKTLICTQNQAIKGKCYYETFSWQGKTLYQGYVSHFVELHRQIWWYQTHLQATHSYQSRPSEWFFNTKPVWFHVDRVDKDHVANIYSFGNPLLFWIGDAFIGVSLLVVILKSLSFILKAKLKNIKLISQLLHAKFKLVQAITIPPLLISNLTPITYNLLAYLIVWLPWQLSPRIMFFYHYTPAVPLLSINLAYWMIKLIDSKKMKLPLSSKTEFTISQIFVFVSLFFILLTFIIWYPHWTAIPMPNWWVNTVYFALKSWK